MAEQLFSDVQPLPLIPTTSHILEKEEEKIVEEPIFTGGEILPGEKEEIIESDVVFTGGEKIKEIETEVLPDDEFTFTGGEEVEVSNLEKLEYGWDKNQMVFGNILDIGTNAIQALFDPDKTFQDYAVENEAERIKEFEAEHWKMLDGAHDGAYTVIGEAATFLLDPYYIAGYFYGSPMLLSPMTSMALNAGLMGGDSVIEDLAKRGEVNWGKAGKTAAIGGGIGLVFPLGGKVIAKYLPNALKGKTKQIEAWIDGKIAKKNNLTVQELKEFRKVAQTDSVKKITNELDNLILKGANFEAPIQLAKSKLNTLKSNLAKEAFDANKLRKILKKELKIPQAITTLAKRPLGSTPAKVEAIKSYSKQIIDSRLKIKAAQKAWKIENDRLVKRQSERLIKYSDLEAKRTAEILAKLKGTETFKTKALKAVMANLTKPLIGGATGAAANVGAGAMGFDVEDDFYGWVLAGAILGGTQKAIQSSKKFSLGDKKLYGKLIDNHAVRFTLQKLREVTAGTLSTKLNAFGGTTEKISKLLLRTIDDPMAEKSVIAEAEAMERYFFRKADNLIKGTTPLEQIQAVSINRGNTVLAAEASPKVLQLSKDLKLYLDEFKTLYNKAGFYSPKELDNYFPRVLNWENINADRATAEKIFADIFKKEYKLTSDKALKAAKNYLERSEGPGFSSVINQNAWNKIIAGTEYGVARKGDALIHTPISDHIIKQRMLTGEYKNVEAILEKHGFLVNDLGNILPRIVHDSVKSIAFARKFGKDGQLLRPLLQNIKQKYDDLALKDNKLGFKSTRHTAAKHEAKMVLNSIDAYFDRFGIRNVNSFKSSVGILTMLSNLNMLGRVTISSLGDLIQPFQNSASWTAAIKGMGKTNLFKATWEKGLAKNLNYDITNEMSRALAKAAGAESKQILLNHSWIGKWGVKDFGKTEFYNNLAFKGLGLEWLTGYARRFAYNTGTADAFHLAKNYYKVVNGAKGAKSRAALLIERDLRKIYGLTKNEALTLGASKNFNTAIKNELNRKFLNQAGIISSNRDALIPQVSNRLLFTQNKTPWIRMLGQFMSWAQAKSAQTNKILMRIENGDARTLIKTLAIIPMYSGIQMLRDFAKHGDIISDPAYNPKELLAKSWQLSGIPGWLSDLVFNRFVGPGSKASPFFVFAPALNMLNQIGTAASEAITGQADKAWQRINKKVLPTPEWREWVRYFWSGPKSGDATKPAQKGKATFVTGGIVLRKKFNKGDEVFGSNAEVNEIKKDVEETAAMEDINLNQQEDMNKKDIASMAAAAAITATGVDADINKAVENNIVPPPIEEEQILPEEKPIYAEGTFVDYIKQVENPNLKYGMIHKSAEGGNDTIAFGHKLTDEEIKNNKVYGYNLNELTEENAKHILLLDLQNADEQLQADYGEKYNKLDKKRKQMLIDFQYNMGSERVKQFKNFKEGLFSNDINKMKEEYERGFTNKEGEFKKLTNRNKEFFNYFFVDK